MSKFSFGHLLGLGGTRAAEDPDDNKGSKAEDDEDLRKSKKVENDDDDQKESEAENDDDAPDASEDDEKEKAMACERNRCAAIFATSYAAKNTALAAELAFNTRLSVTQAKAIMKAALAVVVNQKGGLSARMHSAPQPDTGRDASPAPTGTHALAQEAMALYNEANGGKKA